MKQILCTCGQPMRFVSSKMVILGIIPTELVGIECPDSSCKKNRVMRSDDWKESLQPLRTWPDSAVFN